MYVDTVSYDNRRGRSIPSTQEKYLIIWISEVLVEVLEVVVVATFGKVVVFGIKVVGFSGCVDEVWLSGLMLSSSTK